MHHRLRSIISSSVCADLRHHISYVSFCPGHPLVYMCLKLTVILIKDSQISNTCMRYWVHWRARNNNAHNIILYQVTGDDIHTAYYRSTYQASNKSNEVSLACSCSRVGWSRRASTCADWPSRRTRNQSDATQYLNVLISLLCDPRSRVSTAVKWISACRCAQ